VKARVLCCAETDQVWQNNVQRPLSPSSNGKWRSVDARPAAASPTSGVKARGSTSEPRNVASPVPQLDANASKPASMLNRFKLFNSRDRTSPGAGVREVNGVVVQPSSMSQESSPASRRQLPTLTQKGSGSQIPAYSTGTFPADEQHQLPQQIQSGPSGRYGSAGVASPGRTQRQRAPPPPERHMSPGTQEARRGRVLPTGPPSDQYAGETASTNTFGFGSGSSNRYPQQKTIQSRRNAERGGGGNSREVFIDQPPGGGDEVGAVYDGSRSSSSSVPSRTESSTSISSIASSSTTGGVASARRSGLARRVSSSTQPDKRNTKIAVAAAAGSSTRSKSAKPSSSSIPGPSTPGSISRTAARQLATSGEPPSAGGVRRQKGAAPTSTKDDGVGSSVTTTETTSTEHEGKAGRGLIPRRNSSRAGQLVDRGAVEVMSPSSGRKLPQIVDSRRSTTTDTDATRGCTPSSDAVTGSRKSTADGSTDATSTSKPSRMPQPSVGAVSRLSGDTSQSPASLRLSSPATNSCDSADVEKHRRTPVSTSHDDRLPTTPVSVTAPPSPAISGGQVLMYRSASVGRPTKEKSNGSISSGFGDESNNSTSDSTDSVIFQPQSASSTASRQNASRTTDALSSTVNALCESSSSAIDSDSPPSERTASKTVESSGADCSPVSSPQSPAPTHQTVDHITSLRGSRRQSSEDAAPAVKAVSSPVDQCHAPTPSSDNSACEPTSPQTTELVDAFDAIKPMQPLIRSSIPCCVYEPSTRRLPTLLAQSAAGSPSHRLVFSRPPIGPGVATAGGRGALVGRSGTRANGEESTAACGYMSDGDVVRGGGSGRAAVSRATDRLMSGYTSEGGGGGVSSYARRMQQRFLEGILAVRQSMERTPQFTDDDRSEAF